MNMKKLNWSLFSSGHRPFLRITALLSILILSGCVSASAGLTTSNIPLEGRKYKVLGSAETSVSWFSIDLGIIGFPLSRPPVDEALKELMNSKGGDALINIRYSTDRMILTLVTLHRFHVKADVVKLEAAPPPEETKPKRRRGRR